MEASATTWLNTRSAGVLAHVSALPGKYGIGNLGPSAHRFVDFLGEAGVRYWQICPIGPTGYGDSPYQSFSGRAGNPYFIDLEELQNSGLLHEDDLAGLSSLPTGSVDFGVLYERFWPVLARAHDRFFSQGLDVVSDMGSFVRFQQANVTWLQPFSQFMALKEEFGGRAWTEWPEEFRSWDPALGGRLGTEALAAARRHAFYQYLFFGQWERLRRHAQRRGVGIIGDVPIFVALDSADTWQSRAEFELDAHGRPSVCAGVPPDYFSTTGQLWGNPLYNWEHLSQTGYAWWIERLRAAFALYDVIRLDHFRGFDTYWAIPAGAADACGGEWRKGPGLPFFQALKKALPQLRIIAEDLGYIGPDVVALRKSAGLPGMKVLQFSFGHDAHNVNLPHCYTADSVAYTGTHDNNTTRGWLESMSSDEAALIDGYFDLKGSRSSWSMIRHLLATVSRLAVVPMQDLLDLPSEATFNRPGTSTGNWQWRFNEDQLDSLYGERLASLRRWITLYDRRGDRILQEHSEPLVS